jgi:hypothetical protein
MDDRRSRSPLIAAGRVGIPGSKRIASRNVMFRNHKGVRAASRSMCGQVPAKMLAAAGVHT